MVEDTKAGAMQELATHECITWELLWGEQGPLPSWVSLLSLPAPPAGAKSFHGKQSQTWVVGAVPGAGWLRGRGRPGRSQRQRGKELLESGAGDCTGGMKGQGPCTGMRGIRAGGTTGGMGRQKDEPPENKSEG